MAKKTNIPQEGWINPQQVAKKLSDELGFQIPDKTVRDYISKLYKENVDYVKEATIKHTKSGEDIIRYNTMVAPETVESLKNNPNFQKYCDKKINRDPKNKPYTIPTINHTGNDIMIGDAFTFEEGFNYYSANGCCVVGKVYNDRCTLIPMSARTKDSVYNSGVHNPITFDCKQEDVLNNGTTIGNIFPVANYIMYLDNAKDK